MKKAAVSCVIILLFSSVVFFIGWVQLAVPAGMYAVQVSKTSGTDPKTIEPGRFRWEWARLIPTNAQLYTFELRRRQKGITIASELPAGSLYSQILEGKPDFRWKVDVSVSARLAADYLPTLVDKQGIHDQAALDTWVDETIDAYTDTGIKTAIATLVSASRSATPATSASGGPQVDLSGGLEKAVLANHPQSLEILSVSLNIVQMPDFELYRIGADAYQSYQKQRSTLIAQAAAAEAADSVSEYLQIERFSRWGEVLQKYPILIDFLAVTGPDMESSFKALRSVRQK
jgi:hypothetical protein